MHVDCAACANATGVWAVNCTREGQHVGAEVCFADVDVGGVGWRDLYGTS